MSSSELTTLKSEINHYKDLSGQPVYPSKNPKSIPCGVMSVAAAVEKAKTYMKTIYDYQIPENTFYHVYQLDNSEDVRYNPRLKKEFYYKVSFIVTSHNKNDIDCSITINGKNGNCVGGFFLNRAIPYKTPTDAVINQMKDRALKFITDKNLAAGSRCIYRFTDYTSLQDPDSDGILATELYLSNGYIIDVHENCQKSTLEFHIFPAHGLSN